MRLATFNILHGRTVGDGVVDVQRLQECVRSIDADVLALQEVDVDQPRSNLADLTAAAAEAMGAVTHRFVAAIAGTPGAAWSAATGDERPGAAAYGISLLSRYPATAWQVVRMSRIPVKVPVYVRGLNRVIVIDEEPRAAVIGCFQTPLGPLTVANTHLSFVPGWNRRQLRHLTHDLRALPGPHVIAGDLNLGPRAARRSSGMRALATTPTFPFDSPSRQLDHLLTDDDGLIATEARAPQMPISDHRPLIVDLSRRR
ncbi:endonuclease/exonuclease/phosphatase family protein [Mycobacterium sp. NPDC006124]|uniref:endonuclease/exonuclease/phosphatase family protein n=1 Tax=Mycobacterium sp. NPDC006124 TaxID=3156729 RepID=UPI0033A25C9D